MNRQKDPVKGFSKLSKAAKQEWLINNYCEDPEKSLELLMSYNHPNKDIQKLHDEFIENTISNYYMPFGIAPNFIINDKMTCIPLAIEESSVVAAAAKSASYWASKGGFKATVLGREKIGHVHFVWRGKNALSLQAFFDANKHKFLDSTKELTKNMEKRGGGIIDIELIDKTNLEPNFYQIKGTFNTVDSMGANFINSILEEFSKVLQREIATTELIPENEREVEVIMCILSNFTPNCIVRAEVSCPVEELAMEGISGEEFAQKFINAIKVAKIDPYRAVTHNKGIMNGVDSVIIATGNDFRAVEACVHAYASKEGRYSSLTHAEVSDGIFRFWIDLPLSVGTVGGITALHPMVKFAHEILGKPNADELMEVIAVAGLAQNFAAVRSLVTTGIQKGHMKMHLLNILNQLEATEEEKSQIVEYFKDKIVSHSAAVEIFTKLRGEKTRASN